MSTTTKNGSRKPPKRLWTYAFDYPGGVGYYGMLFRRRKDCVASMRQPLPQARNLRLVSWTLDAPR